jgi:hydroxyacylglutathione hydrolase
LDVDAEHRDMVEIVRIPALSDNYIWLVHEPASGETMVVDPAEAEPVLRELEARGWRLSQIWNTHWHPDHTGGNVALKAATGCFVTGPAAEAGKILTLDRHVGEGDRVRLGAVEAIVMEVPAHTAGHIAYHLPKEATVFVGDTLFAMGCGRLFEGTAEQMHANLQRLATLPPETEVYCAHEYTQSNARFAVTIDPENRALRRRATEVDAARAEGRATVPTTIRLELDTNPFVRASSAAELAEIRRAKDSFRG